MREVAKPKVLTEGENDPSVTCGDSSPDKGNVIKLIWRTPYAAFLRHRGIFYKLQKST